MSHIWHALVPDPKATVDANYAPICKELLKEMGGRLWRNREASASGLADLLQACSPPTSAAHRRRPALTGHRLMLGVVHAHHCGNANTSMPPPPSFEFVRQPPPQHTQALSAAATARRLHLVYS